MMQARMINNGEVEEDVEDLEHNDDLLVTSLLQAAVFLEDALGYRSISHKLHKRALIFYRFYHSKFFQYILTMTLLTLHLLAFFEWPSSLSLTADVMEKPERIRLACGVTETVEILCLLLFLFDACFKVYVMGARTTIHNFWLLAYFIVLFVSFGDWCITVVLSCGAANVFRIRRILRPFFLVQNSSLMKKTIKCLRRTLPQILSVLLLVAVHLYIFTLLGMCLFHFQPKTHGNKSESSYVLLSNVTNTTNITHPTPLSPIEKESEVYFRYFDQSLRSMLILLTTANNPDIMMPVYNSNRFYSLFFICFLAVGLFCYMNMLLAVMYNHFRGYFSSSIQTSLFRRRLAVQAAFEVLVSYRIKSGFIDKTVSCDVIRRVLSTAYLPSWLRSVLLADLNDFDKSDITTLSKFQFQHLFKRFDNSNAPPSVVPACRSVESAALRRLQACVTHHVFVYFGMLVCCVNVICITVEISIRYEEASVGGKQLQFINTAFIIFYLIEQCLKFWALGWRLYCYSYWNIYDGLVTLLVFILQICDYTIFTFFIYRANHSFEFFDLVRVINMLLVLRLLRVVPMMRSTRLVLYTLADLFLNMRFFVGLFVLIYYSFGIVGMELFAGRVKSDFLLKTAHTCGSYSNSKYNSNNFDDFAAAIVTLWDIMVVNNWHVIMEAYSKLVGPWSIVFFVTWWLVAVIIVLNLVTALIMENFVTRVDRLKALELEGNPNSTSEAPSALIIDDASLPSTSTSTAAAAIRRERTPRVSFVLTVHDLFRERLREPSVDDLTKEIYRSSPYLRHMQVVASATLARLRNCSASYDEGLNYSQRAGVV